MTRRKHSPALVALVALVTATVALTGCSPTREISGDVYLEYGGPYDEAVERCSLDAADGNRRDDEQLPGGFRLTDIRVEEGADAALQVDGILRVLAADPEAVDVLYAWSCATSNSAETSTVTEFDRVDG